MFDRKTYEKRVEWYQHDRFGMFIHWGLYAIPARGEWVRSTEEMPEDDYLPFFEEFNPVDYEMGESGEGSGNEICGADCEAP
jgi:alpha-L-fucosidase